MSDSRTVEDDVVQAAREQFAEVLKPIVDVHAPYVKYLLDALVDAAISARLIEAASPSPVVVDAQPFTHADLAWAAGTRDDGIEAAALDKAVAAFRDSTFEALTLDECRDAATAAVRAYQQAKSTPSLQGGGERCDGGEKLSSEPCPKCGATMDNDCGAPLPEYVCGRKPAPAVAEEVVERAIDAAEYVTVFMPASPTNRLTPLTRENAKLVIEVLDAANLLATPAPVAGAVGVLAEMLAIAAGEYDGYGETLDPWTSENRAIIDRWYSELTASPQAPVGASDFNPAASGAGKEEHSLVERICRAVCKIEGLDPDEDSTEYESEAHAYRPGDPHWTKYADAVAAALASAPQSVPAGTFADGIEAAASIAKEMREKHGSPAGNAYLIGVWDQGVRIEQKIRALKGQPAPGASPAIADEVVSRAAEAIHRGRFPADREPTPFEAEDRSGRDYCFRIARTLAAANLLASTAPVGQPVAWRYMNEEGDDAYADNEPFVAKLIADGKTVTPLYAAPVQEDAVRKALLLARDHISRTRDQYLGNRVVEEALSEHGDVIAEINTALAALNPSREAV